MNLKKSFLEYCEDQQFEINQNQIGIIDNLKEFYLDNFKQNFLNKLLFDYLKKESAGFSKESIELEHQVTYILEQQRINGFKIDIQYATNLLSELNCKIKEVQDEVHRTFKPKVSDLVIMNQDLPKQLKLDIRHELLSDILQGDSKLPQKRP